MASSLKQLGQLRTVTALRHDRSERALKLAAETYAVRQAELAAAVDAEKAATLLRARSNQMLAEDPACGQAQFWRQVTAQRAREALDRTSAAAAHRDEADDLLGEARVALRRAQTRRDQAIAGHGRVCAAVRRRSEEREAEEWSPTGQMPW